MIVNFWASWCPPCRAEMPSLQAVYEDRLPQGDLMVIAIDFLPEDHVGSVAQFIDEFDLTFPVVFDVDGSVKERYGVRGLPATFFIDRNGIVRSLAREPAFGQILPEGIAAADAAGS